MDRFNLWKIIGTIVLMIKHPAYFLNVSPAERQYMSLEQYERWKSRQSQKISRTEF